MCAVLIAFLNLFLCSRLELIVHSMIAINWPLLILTDSREFPRKLTIAGMVKLCQNEAKVTNKGLMEIKETCIQRACPI